MNRLVEELAPGGRLIRSRRLRGGLGARMHVVSFETAAGARSKAVLRRYRPEWGGSTPQDAAYEFRVLSLLQEAGLPAPRPIWLDADGRVFGVPALVLSYVPGNSFNVDPQGGAWIVQLADALLAVHRAEWGRFDLSWLHDAGRDYMRRKPEQWLREDRFVAEPLAHDVLRVIERQLDEVALQSPTLIHSDFWPGNTVWYRGKLAAIIDWGGAKLGDPRVDVAQCRLDLVFSHGAPIADAFLEAYESALGRRLADMPFFDLFVGMPALLFHPIRLQGYLDAGGYMAPGDPGERIRDLLRHRLEEM